MGAAAEDHRDWENETFRDEPTMVEVLLAEIREEELAQERHEFLAALEREGNAPTD